MDSIFTLSILGILLLLAIFFLCREVVCWYFKYNIQVANQERMIKNQERIIALLEKNLLSEDTDIKETAENNRMDTINPF